MYTIRNASAFPGFQLTAPRRFQVARKQLAAEALAFAASDKFQPELTADSDSSALKSVQCNTRVSGIEQTIERSTAGSHADRHCGLGEAILLHGRFDLIGEDLFDGLFLALFQNALLGQKAIKR
jgi:hypothetical protein